MMAGETDGKDNTKLEPREGAASHSDSRRAGSSSGGYYNRQNGSNSYDRQGGYSRGGYGDRYGGDRYGSDQGGSGQGAERPKANAMEVFVESNIEKAMKVLKRKLIKEGLFKELKSRRYYEKPSERKKRKQKESVKKVRKEEARQKKNSLLFS